MHLLDHEGTPDERRESEARHLQEHLGWSPDVAERVIATGVREGILERDGIHLRLTDLGRETVRKLMNRG